jgi:hypothetical protein
LYAALLRELGTKKDQARFRKTARGKFGLAEPAGNGVGFAHVGRRRGRGG